jgi:Uma2 family endonuclease
MASLIDARVTDLTAEEFSVLLEAGVFGDRRVFLWAGRVCEKMAKANAHAFVAERISKAVGRLLPADWETWHENPIRLGRKHVPLPDFSVVRGPLDRYRRRNPQPDDIGLVVEVAVTSLAADVGKRAARYARSGVPCYWVADAVNRQIIAHRGPRVVGAVASSAAVERVSVGDEVELELAGVAIGRIALADVF